MLHISYIFIQEFRSLHNLELTLDYRYSCHYDSQSRTLSVKHQNLLPEDFWGSGIYALSAIIGNNGTGKSSALSFLLNAVVEGDGVHEVDGIIVYEDNGRLFVYKGPSLTDVNVKSNGTDYLSLTDLRKIPVFYYSAHFMPFRNTEDLRTTQYSGYYNGTDINRIIQDLQNYSNIDSIRMNNGLYFYLDAFVAQNNDRICRMLADKKLRETFDAFILPKYIIVGLNQAGSSSWNQQYLLRKKELLPEQRHIKFASVKQNLLFQFVYYNIVNVLYDTDYCGDSTKILDEWQKYVDGNKDVLSQLKSFANKTDGKSRQALVSIYNVIERLCTLSHYEADRNFFYFDVEKDSENIAAFIASCDTKLYITSRYCNLYYCKSLKPTGETILSSGEQEMLDLFSRIYDAVFLSHKKASNLTPTHVLLLDEAEMGYHPEWQRRYIYTVLQFLKALPVLPGRDFQVILSSHSPILLSDIPKVCCNLLKRDNDGNVYNIRDISHETFASNVFEQYRNSFFLEDGLIGEFANLKIKDLVKRVEEGSIVEDSELMAIGDLRIRNYLITKRDGKFEEGRNKDELRAYYSNKLQQLQHE